MKALFLGLFFLGKMLSNSNYQNQPFPSDSNFSERWHSAYLENINTLLKTCMQKKDKISSLILKNLKTVGGEWTDSSSLRNLFIKEIIAQNKEFANQENLILEYHSSGDKNYFSFKVINLNTKGRIYAYGFKDGHWNLKSQKDTNTLFIKEMFFKTNLPKSCKHIYVPITSIFLTMVKNNVITCNVIPAICDEQFMKWRKWL